MQEKYPKRLSADITLHIGDYYASSRPVIIKTLLGSCIAVCLFDPDNRIGGMNHILLPGAADLKTYDLSARFGVNAMELLINGMMKLGADRRLLVAKIFGGANLLPSLGAERTSPGEQNISFARSFLEMESISLVSEDVGGNDVRIIYLFTDTGQVLLKRRKATGAKFMIKTTLEKRDAIRAEMEKIDGVTLFNMPDKEP